MAVVVLIVVVFVGTGVHITHPDALAGGVLDGDAV